jgi:hypothetical protein
MRLAVVALVSAALLVVCDTGHGQWATARVQTLDVEASRPSAMEQQWLEELGLTPSSPTASGARASRLAKSIRKAVKKSGVQVQIVRLKIYSRTPLSGLAPALVLAVIKPAYYLRHRLRPILPLLASSAYLRIVDGRARRALEWYGTPNGGALYVRPGLEKCSPIVAFGWPINLPPCPSK